MRQAGSSPPLYSALLWALWCVLFGVLHPQSLLCQVNRERNSTCSIRIPANADLDLILMFEEQTRRLSAPITLDIIEDVEFERVSAMADNPADPKLLQDPQVHPWTHDRRFANTGGVMEVHTTFAHIYSDSTKPATLTVPKNADAFPLKLNDWVLFDATLHKSDSPDKSGPRVRCGLPSTLSAYIFAEI
jgi:hypothetical protein